MAHAPLGRVLTGGQEVPFRYRAALAGGVAAWTTDGPPPRARTQISGVCSTFVLPAFQTKFAIGRRGSAGTLASAAHTVGTLRLPLARHHCGSHCRTRATQRTALARHRVRPLRSLRPR